MKYEGAAGKEIYINGGKVRNQGIELTASYIFAPNNNFSWITNFNYAYNDNKILTVARKQNGQKYIHEIDMGNLSGLKIKFEEGGSYGDLYAVDFMRDEITGEIVVDPQTGAPFKLNGQANEYLGNMNAKHTLGWSNTFNYKDFSFYFLIDGKLAVKSSPSPRHTSTISAHRNVRPMHEIMHLTTTSIGPPRTVLSPSPACISREQTKSFRSTNIIRLSAVDHP